VLIGERGARRKEQGAVCTEGIGAADFR
jgi:hypothetical protein